jgi:hypothetical protein
MAVVKNTITVTSDSWNEDDTVRSLVGGLTASLERTPGRASRLSVVQSMTRYQQIKLVAKVTVEQSSGEVVDGQRLGYYKNG